jgi:MSHA biogenesis protein MshL
LASVLGTGSGLYGLAFQTATFAALLNFLESQGSVSVLSSPRIATLNNQKAVLKVGTDEYYVTNVTVGSGGTTSPSTGLSTSQPTLAPTFSALFSGIALDVTPQIDDGENIVLHVHTLITTVTERDKSMQLGYDKATTIPIASGTVNETDSIVRVKDGNIVAIGGLMSQRQRSERDGLPGSEGSVLFGTRGRELKKSELVVLIKPTIIRDAADWQALGRETLDRLKEFAPPASVRISQ